MNIKKHQTSLPSFLDKANYYAQGLAYQKLLRAKKKAIADRLPPETQIEIHGEIIIAKISIDKIN